MDSRGVIGVKGFSFLEVILAMAALAIGTLAIASSVLGQRRVLEQSSRRVDVNSDKIHLSESLRLTNACTCSLLGKSLNISREGQIDEVKVDGIFSYSPDCQEKIQAILVPGPHGSVVYESISVGGFSRVTAMGDLYSAKIEVIGALDANITASASSKVRISVPIHVRVADGKIEGCTTSNSASTQRGGNYETLVRHTQSAAEPPADYCQTQMGKGSGWEELWRGYSFAGAISLSYQSVWMSRGQDLSQPGACLRHFDPGGIIGCNGAGCLSSSTDDSSYSLWISTKAFSEATQPGPNADIYDPAVVRQMVSRCVVCGKHTSRVIAVHSQTNDTPECPPGDQWRSLWEGYSYYGSERTDAQSNLAGSGSCMPEFLLHPTAQCNGHHCYAHSAYENGKWLAAGMQGTAPALGGSSTGNGYYAGGAAQLAAQLVSRCRVCERE
ncbi:MAG: hypothetical protein AB7P04_01895 [Bacteriovoracia bacterium]